MIGRWHVTLLESRLNLPTLFDVGQIVGSHSKHSLDKKCWKNVIQHGCCTFQHCRIDHCFTTMLERVAHALDRHFCKTDNAKFVSALERGS